jgi:hypothetical protein
MVECIRSAVKGAEKASAKGNVKKPAGRKGRKTIEDQAGDDEHAH